jgi:hypothetical protein
MTQALYVHMNNKIIKKIIWGWSCGSSGRECALQA